MILDRLRWEENFKKTSDEYLRGDIDCDEYIKKVERLNKERAARENTGEQGVIARLRLVDEKLTNAKDDFKDGRIGEGRYLARVHKAQEEILKIAESIEKHEMVE